jgi:2-C-methyl-D-erythritol 4-phosphate cytidylyltransferase
MEAHRQADIDVNDDAQLVELTGGRVKLYPGAYDNIKVTTPTDLAIARALWRKRKA